MRAAVESGEFLALELEADGHDAAFRARPCFAVTGNLADLRVFENAGIEMDRLLGLIIEPQKGRDLLFYFHRSFASVPCPFKHTTSDRRGSGQFRPVSRQPAKEVRKSRLTGLAKGR